MRIRTCGEVHPQQDIYHSDGHPFDDERLKEIKERLANVYQGEWWQGMYFFDCSNEMVFSDGKVIASTRERTYPCAGGWDTVTSFENAKFIANSKQDIAWLIRELEQYV